MADEPTNISETVPGGAYQLPDGSWVNANGKKIAPPKGAKVQAKPESKKSKGKGKKNEDSKEPEAPAE